MDSQAVALLIAAGGLLLGGARLIISILSYRLDARRDEKPEQVTHEDDVGALTGPKTDAP